MEGQRDVWLEVWEDAGRDETRMEVGWERWMEVREEGCMEGWM